MRFSWVLLAALLASGLTSLVTSGCSTNTLMGYGSDADLPQRNAAEAAAFLRSNRFEDGVRETPSGLQYLVLQEGSGASPKRNSRVAVHYEGRLLDGTVFDSSRASPATRRAC